MKFKTNREGTDFLDLYGKNRRLARLLDMLDSFVNIELSKDITITSIHRTYEENKAANAASTIHVIWRAADIRSSDFTKDEQIKILAFLNQFTYRGTKGKPVAMLHSVPGGAEHIHIQYF